MKWRYAVASLAILLSITACSDSQNSPGNQGAAPAENMQGEQGGGLGPDNRPETDGNGAGVRGEASTGDGLELGEEAGFIPAGADRGEMPGVQPGLGSETSEVVAALGQPGDVGYFAGGLYLGYDSIVYFSDGGLTEEGDMIHGKVVMLGFPGQSDVFGVKVGMAFGEIEAALGPADMITSPAENVNDEFIAEDWAMQYVYGSYRLVFVAAAEGGPTNAAYYGPL